RIGKWHRVVDRMGRLRSTVDPHLLAVQAHLGTVVDKAAQWNRQTIERVDYRISGQGLHHRTECATRQLLGVRREEREVEIPRDTALTALGHAEILHVDHVWLQPEVRESV